LLIEAEVRRIPSGTSGIYALHHYWPQRGVYPIFYVGQTRDLRRRLWEHTRIRSAKPIITAARTLGRSYFSAAPVPPSALDLIESALIRELRPICNGLIRSGPRAVINLPPMFFTS
jgi:hypothetical protein